LRNKKIRKEEKNMYGHEGMLWGWWWMMIFWIAVIVGLFFLIKWFFEKGRADRNTSPIHESALDILKKRYAKGEINKDEFEQKKKDLLS
jgi:putative membrane protein